jgi:hypothetical protein
MLAEPNLAAAGFGTVKRALAGRKRPSLLPRPDGLAIAEKIRLRGDNSTKERRANQLLQKKSASRFLSPSVRSLLIGPSNWRPPPLQSIYLMM